MVCQVSPLSLEMRQICRTVPSSSASQEISLSGCSAGGGAATL